jgi:CelD/BcsL family acetyltransferase involved in cellulose biosynthesis
MRRLEANGARFRQVTESTDLSKEMGRFFDLHDARWEASGGSAALDGEARRFHDRFAHLALRRGWLRLWFLDLEDRPVAGWYGYSIGGRYCFYLPGFHPAHGHLGVGKRLMIHGIECAAAEGASTYDFLSGDEDYKRRFETGRRFTHSLLITRRRHAAQPVAATLAAIIGVARRLPASVRSRGRRALGAVRSSA